MDHVDHSNILQTTPTPQSFMLSYNDFLKWYQNNYNSSSVVSVAHTSNSFVCLSQTYSFGSWVLYFGGSNHVTGNIGILSSLFTSNLLPTITSYNDSPH